MKYKKGYQKNYIQNLSYIIYSCSYCFSLFVYLFHTVHVSYSIVINIIICLEGEGCLEYGEGVVVRRFIFTMKHIISNTLMEI